MNRIRQGQAEVISRALDYIPCRFYSLLGHDAFCEDPIFAGLYVPGIGEGTDDGRSYRNIAHVAWPHHARDGRTTIVWPRIEKSYGGWNVAIAIHELGHVLHQHLLERDEKAVPRLDVVTDYAQTNVFEEFAESFCAWAGYTPQMLDQDAYWYGYSRRNAEFFDRLLRA